MLLEMARRNLSRHPVRSTLATIGIIIGVIAIASLGIFGNSLKLSAMTIFSEVGNELIIQPDFNSGKTEISEDQFREIERISGGNLAVPVISEGVVIEFKKEKTYAAVYGLTEDNLESLFEIDTGRYFSRGSEDCVIGSSFARTNELRAGDKLTFEGHTFRIVGVLKQRGFSFGISPDSSVFISIERYKSIFEVDGYQLAIVKAMEIEDVQSLKDNIESRLNRKETTVSVIAMDVLLENINQLFDTISMFLMGIGAISLIVAGVSILNIMLMSTMERTKEIGIMRAVGIPKNDILKMFMLESSILGVLGSIIGGFLSLGGGYILNVVILNQAIYLFDPSTLIYIVGGILVGISTGLLGGFYPAWKASRMRPLDALRYE